MAENPYITAWEQLTAFITSGASYAEVTAYAIELGRRLPDPLDPLARDEQATAMQRALSDIRALAPRA